VDLSDALLKILESLKKLNAQVRRESRLRQLTRYTSIATVQNERIDVVGWNIPLACPAGLGKEGESELGRVLAMQLDKK
jgi:hypothetical protein